MTTSRRSRPAARPRRPRPADYPAVAAFLRGYLHEDFAAEHESAAAALTCYLEDSSPQERAALAAESVRLLAAVSKMRARDLPRLVSALGGAWQPEDGEEVRALLVRMKSGS